jgi:hypothetical protein
MEVVVWKFVGSEDNVCVYLGDAIVLRSTLIGDWRVTNVEFVEDPETPGPVSKRKRNAAMQVLQDAGYVIVISQDEHANMPDRSPLRQSADEAMALAKIKVGKGD